MTKREFKSKVFSRIMRFYKLNGLFSKGDFVIVGISGGADSVCLLHFLDIIREKEQINLIACHINHGLRKESQAEEKFVKDFCKKYEIKCYTKKVNVKTFAKKNNLSVEHAARNLRYKTFEQIAKKHKANKIALAHHLDDNIETVFLNILRGTKANGLTGIPVKRKLSGKIEIIRPFLGIGKKDILAYAKHNDLKFVEDKTNQDTKFTRNWVRLKLIPMLEKKQPKIKQHIQIMCEDLLKNLKK